MSCNYKTNIKDIQSKYTFKIFCAGDTSQIEQEIGDLSQLTTTAKDNLVNAINEVDGDLSAKEDKSNKVTTITSSSTDTQYPSAKLLYNQLALKENVANKTTTLSSSSTDTQYPSAKAVYDSQVAQDETISTLESNLEETQAELDYYKTIYNVLPKVEGNGESITLDNTGESILKLDPRGQCKQDGEPTPNAPQQIHEVSGDNEVVVRGKQLFDGELELGILDGDTGQPVANTSYMRTKNFILVEELTEYVINSIDISAGLAVYEYKEDYTYNLTSNKVLSNEQAFTTEAGTKYIKFRPRTANTDLTSRFMLNKGSTPSTYEPYNGDTYELDLGVENLLNPSNLEQGWINTSGEESSYSNRTRFDDYVKVESSTSYYLSSLGITSSENWWVHFYDENKQWLSYYSASDMTSHNNIFTTPNNCKYVRGAIAVQDTTISNGILTKSDKPTSYTPYGQTPIKMRGIGTYEDYFVRNSGKNLFDVEAWVTKGNNGTYYSYSNGELSINAVDARTFGNFTEQEKIILPNGIYYLSNIGNAGIRIYNQGNDMATSTNQFEVTLGYIYLKLVSESVMTCQPMLNKGNTALPYEPYGTGQWCKYNAIGSIVLDGSEGTTPWSTAGVSTDGNYYRFTNTRFATLSIPNVRYYSDKFKTLGNVSSLDVSEEGTANTSSSARFYLWISKTRVNGTSSSDIVSWLTNNNVIVDYINAQPYLSLIESQTLISQLDKVEKALGKDGQTNISQINNDAPFKIYASALMKISGE